MLALKALTSLRASYSITKIGPGAGPGP